LPPKRQVKMVYRGEVVPVQVTSIGDEVDIQFAAGLKSLGVQVGFLPKLWCEDWVVEKAGTKYKAKPDKALFKEAIAARDLVRQLVQEAGVQTADVLAKLMGQKTASLLLVDRGFRVELAVIGPMLAEGSESKLHRSLLMCLPAHDRIFGPEVAAQRLHHLAAGELFKMSATGCQQELRLTQELVGAIVEDRRLDVAEALKSTTMSAVVASFAWFVSHTIGSAGEKKGCLWRRGRRMQARRRHRDIPEGQGHLGRFTPLKVYHWLVADDQAQALDKLARSVSANASAALKAVRGKSSASSSKKAAGDKEVALKAALDMFK